MLSELPLALNTRAGVHLLAGETEAAAALIDEADALARATDGIGPLYGALALAAHRGREDELKRLVRAGTEDSWREARGWVSPQ